MPCGGPAQAKGSSWHALARHGSSLPAQASVWRPGAIAEAGRVTYDHMEWAASRPPTLTPEEPTTHVADSPSVETVARSSSVAASVHFGAPLIALQHGLVLPLALAEECCPEKVVPRLAADVLSARVENDDVVLVGNKQMRTLLRTVPAIHFGLGQNIGRCPSASLGPRSWAGWQALLGSHIREHQGANLRAAEHETHALTSRTYTP